MGSLTLSRFRINFGQSVGPDGASTLGNHPSKAAVFYSYLFAGHPKISQQSCGSLMNSSLLTNTLDFVTFCDLSEQTRDRPVSISHLLKIPVLKLQQLLYLDCFSYIIPSICGVSCYLTTHGRRGGVLYSDKALLGGYS